MVTDAKTFDAHVQAWLDECDKPWMRLKYAAASNHINKHLPSLSKAGSLRILDAGGGAGAASLPFASQGHHVTIVDYSGAMLEAARHAAEAQGVQDRVALHQASVMDVAALFPAEAFDFDVVLCHNVLQYVDDVTRLLDSITRPLKSSGLLSLIAINRFSNPFQAAIRQNDLVAALAGVNSHDANAVLFGNEPMRQYSGEEIIALLRSARCSLLGHYGILGITSYLVDNAPKYDPVYYAQLEALEAALSDQHPYYLLARYFHVLARKEAD